MPQEYDSSFAAARFVHVICDLPVQHVWTAVACPVSWRTAAPPHSWLLWRRRWHSLS